MRSAVTRNPEATYLPRAGVRRPGQATTVGRGRNRRRAGPIPAVGPIRWSRRFAAALTAARTLLHAVATGQSERTLRRTESWSNEASAVKTPRRRMRATPFERASNGCWQGTVARRLVVGRTRDQRHDDGRARIAVSISRTADRRDSQRCVAHILQNQREDGSWALYYDGPADLSTTIEAYVALKVLGLDPQPRRNARARWP